MAKATTTIRQVLNHKPAYGAWFAANQALFNCVAAFYFDVIQAHEKVLQLGNQEALTALEHLTHTTKKNPHPVMPLSDIAEDIPAMFRRAAIHAALGSARSFATHLRKWRARKEKAQSKGKKFTERPPVPPQSWNKSATFYTGQWKERTEHSIVLKVWTGTCWSWLKVRITGRESPTDAEMGSPQLATGEQDNVALWRKIRDRDEQLAHLVSRRIVQFAREHEARVIVFEHLGNLTPEKGKYSRRSNTKRAFWMKGRIFRYAQYKAWNEGGVITCRVNPHNTSRECAHCGAQVVRYAAGQPEEGYTPGTPLVRCEQCQMRGHADRNASIVIGQRLIARYQPGRPQEEKPHTPRLAERELKDSGVTVSQEAKGEEQPFIAPTRHGSSNGHGTAHKGKRRRMGTPSLSIPPQLRLFTE